MKRIFTLFAFMLSAAYSYAQTNSVLLMDRVGTVLSAHSTIQGAYNAIPATLTQPYIIELQSTYNSTLETYPVKFVEKAGAGSANTIRITGRYASLSILVDTANCYEFDGADWIIFDGKFMFHTFYSPTRNVFHFKNGACHNTIRGARFLEGVVGFPPTPGRHIYFSPTTISGGNSYNSIERCEFQCSYPIESEGHPGNPNTDISIRQNDMSSYADGIKMVYTNNVSIENNVLSIRAGYRAKGSRALVDLSNVGQQIHITQNLLNVLPDSGIIAGIYLEPTNNCSAFLANNMIAMITAIEPGDQFMDTVTDEMTGVAGIWLEGKGAAGFVKLYHNTITLWGKYSSQATASVRSHCLKITGTHTADVSVKNNIFANYRVGGKNPVNDLVYLQSLPSNMLFDHNRYHSIGGIGSLAGTPLKTWVQYQAALTAINNSDANSDSAKVDFALRGATAHLHLSGEMYADVSMMATPLAEVTYDFDNNLRTSFYKGADEYIINCPPAIQKGILAGNIDSCQGHYSTLSCFGTTPINGVINQWQARPAGSQVAFTDIQGETSGVFNFVNNGPVEYRVATSCLGSSSMVYSDTITVFTKPVPSVDSIKVMKHSGWVYMFTAMGTKLTTGYSWDFGEGVSASRTNNTITYSFKTPGPHDIRLIVTNNNCGYDTAYATLDVGLGIDEATIANTIKVYPNPAADRLMADVAENTAYTVTDVSGRIVLKGKINASGIDISRLNKGLYLLGLVMPDDTRVYTRFVKE